MIKLERELFFGTQTDSYPQVGRGLFGCPYTVEPRLSGLVGTSVKSPDNRESG